MLYQNSNYLNQKTSRIARYIVYKVTRARNVRIFLNYVFCLVLVVIPCVVVAQPHHLTVGVLASPPFVIENDGVFTGLAIDLWEDLATKNNWQFTYQEYETFRELIDAAAQGRIDLAISNITITQQRALTVDFTQPWFDGGMRLMVRSEQGTGLRSIVKGLAQAGFITAYTWIIFVIALATILLTLFDRRFDKSFPLRWREGIAESFYTVMSVVTSGRPPARKNLFGWLGRIWQALWLVCGVAVLAFVTSSVTSVMTTLAITNQINSVDDLGSNPVGVLAGTVEEDYAYEKGLVVRSFPNIIEATNSLINGRITAIIADGPVLEYYSYINSDLPVKVVGRLFERDKYGFALTPHSPFTRELTLAVLGAIDTGKVEELKTKYLGSMQ